MKKLNHPNLVQLIEVLDDPEEDSLYMVMEMCKKGVIMSVGLGDDADPYNDESCRCWFRDLLLGIEYCKFAFCSSWCGIRSNILPSPLIDPLLTSGGQCMPRGSFIATSSLITCSFQRMRF
jgi:serine/threonine protein kinase